MDTLKNKKYFKYGYLCRYTGTPFFYDTLKERESPGIAQSVSLDAPSFTHKVKPGENLDSLALKYYNNPTYWWVIASFNGIQDAFIDALYKEYPILQIPNIGAITFEKEKR
jgi:nucleoid-associated protein YgaU